MKKYYVEGLEKKEIYKKFIRIMLCYSEAFSLVYFRYNERDKIKHSTKTIKKLLEPYKVYTKNVTQWPGTVTKNNNNHIYRLSVYKSNNADWSIINTLEKVNSIWNWDYPKYPMDLAFYRNGLAWFYSITHERINSLYLNEEDESRFLSLRDLESVGIKLVNETEVPNDNVFYDKKAKPLFD